MTKERTEVVFEGTLDSMPGQRGELAQWKEIEFKCKPGSVDRRPCVISPYHYRLDWLMWFAAFQVREGECVRGEEGRVCEGRELRLEEESWGGGCRGRRSKGRG